MKKFRLLTLAALVATMLSVACDKTDKNDPAPDPDPVELVDQYQWNNTVTDIKSVVAEIQMTPIVEFVNVCITPEEGITSVDQLDRTKNHVEILIDSEIADYTDMATETETGMRIDLTKAQGAVYITCYNNGYIVAEYDDETELDEGYIILTENPADDNLSTVDMLLDFAGSSDCLRANFTLDESKITLPRPDYPENYIAEDVFFYEEIQSAFAFDMSGYTFVMMSLTADYATWQDCMEGEDYIMMAVASDALGKTVDMTSYEDYSFVNYSPMCKSVETISPLEPETMAVLAGGELYIAKDGEYTDARFSIRTTDGTLFEGAVRVHTPAPTDCIIFNDETKPVRAAFYYDQYLYLTPGAIDYGEDIGNCSWYLCLTKPAAGETVDVTTAADFMVIFAYDYGEGQIVSQPGSGDTGSYTVKTLGENRYEVTFDVTFADGNRVQCSYSGEFKDFLAEPAKENEYKFQGVSHAINSLVVDTTSSVYTFYISSEAGLTTVADMLTAGSVGTFSALLSDTDLELSFAGYGEAPDIYFKGTAVVVK